ncbi:hypothetical protein GGR57DRAFT_515918 [Xylariaceae sp. FL1272]|nr:hypothetical protein GGR57DRAFT_515918 [Xylariaceae sp. FL1272]
MRMSHEQHHNHNDLPYPTESIIPSGPSPDLDDPLVRRPSEQDHAQREVRLEDTFSLIDDFSTLVLIDDTEPMKTCWDDVGKILEKIGPIYTKYGHGGMNIEFLKHRARGYFLLGGRPGYYNITIANGSHVMQDNVAGVYLHVKPHGHYDMELRISRILDKWIYCVKTTGKERLKRLRPWRLLVVSKWNPDDLGKILKLIRKVSFELEEYGVPNAMFGIQMWHQGENWSGWEVWKTYKCSTTIAVTRSCQNTSKLSSNDIMELILGSNWKMYQGYE